MVPWWAALALALCASAHPEFRPEFDVDIPEPPESDSYVKEQYTIYVSKWTPCFPGTMGRINEQNMRSSERLNANGQPDPLVFTPLLGIQHRQVQCRNKDGHFVEFIYCGDAVRRMGMKRVCVIPQNCTLGEWLPWRPRIDGALVRIRQVLQMRQGNPFASPQCGVVQEVRPAALEASAHWVPGPWGECKVSVEQHPTNMIPVEDDIDSEANNAIYEDDDAQDELDDKDASPASCGGGVQRREVTCVRADGRTLHPVQCAHAIMPTLVQPCEVPCPRDCEVGDWSEWGACQPTDGCPLFPVQQLTTTGYSVRSRRVISAASGGGAPCPPLEEKRTCSTPRCASWKTLPWGPCILNQPHAGCGPGRRSRELLCIGHDGKEAQRAWCGSGAPARSERCRIACAGDCVVSAWEPWTKCDMPCTNTNSRPTTFRRRVILAHPSADGWPCPHDDQLVQNETCNTHACTTYSWLATPWGPCVKRNLDYRPVHNFTDLTDAETFNESDDEEPCVEEGDQSRDVMCVQNNADVVREALCAPLHRPLSRRGCTVRCIRGCKVEAWGPWSPCPNTCDPGKQVRSRTVHGGPNCGALQEERQCPVAKSCRTLDATWIASEWSLCRLPPEEICGSGFRIRSIWCGSATHRVEAGACAGQPMLRSVAPCLVPCEGLIPTLTCDTVCAEPLKYIESSEPEIPNCVCPNVSLELMPSDSDCILPPGTECGEGRALRAARCTFNGKDVPMVVCKKYHPLTGQFRVREASTDGYTYDEEFPALLRGACSVRCVHDCVSGPWGEWGPCTPEAAGHFGFRYRTREIIVEGNLGGRACGPTLQRATCKMNAPSWVKGAWTHCDMQHRSLCGKASTFRTVVCKSPEGETLKDSACVEAGLGPKPETVAPCERPCSGDCVVSDWSEWSPCEMSKWGGRQDRTRVVLRPADEGGRKCPSLVEARSCEPIMRHWLIEPYDDCQPLGGSPCGEGIKTRSVACIETPPGKIVNDSLCTQNRIAPPGSNAGETRKAWCYVPCGVDCAVSEWGPWDDSACTCGVATTNHMRRSRQRLTEPVWPGRLCPVTEQRAPCPREPCLKLVSRPSLGCRVQNAKREYTAEACGWGVRAFSARCEISNGRDETASDLYMEPWHCPVVLPGRIISTLNTLNEEPDQCEVECGCKGYFGLPGPWNAWGPCRNGARSRTRQLLIPPRKACRTSSRYVTIEWANCSGEPSEIPDLLAVEPKDKEDRPHRTWVENDHDSEEFTEQKSQALVAVWAATIVLTFYGSFQLYRGVLRCLRSRKLKTITKV